MANEVTIPITIALRPDLKGLCKSHLPECEPFDIAVGNGPARLHYVCPEGCPERKPDRKSIPGTTLTFTAGPKYHELVEFAGKEPVN